MINLAEITAFRKFFLVKRASVCKIQTCFVSTGISRTTETIYIADFGTFPGLSQQKNQVANYIEQHRKVSLANVAKYMITRQRMLHTLTCRNYFRANYVMVENRPHREGSPILRYQKYNATKNLMSRDYLIRLPHTQFYSVSSSL